MAAPKTSRRALLGALAIAPALMARPAWAASVTAPGFVDMIRKYDAASRAVRAHNAVHDAIYNRWVKAGSPSGAARRELDESLQRDTELSERRLSALEKIIDCPVANIHELSKKMLLLDEQLGLEDGDVRAGLLRDVQRLASSQVRS